MGKLYRCLTFLFLLVFIIVVPLYAFAEESDSVVIPYVAGTWDYKGSQTLNLLYVSSASTNTYTATDGGNFKIDITGTNRLENYVEARIVINGQVSTTKKGAMYWDGTGTIEFNNIPVGAKVWFIINVQNHDSLQLKFYD
ncbi:hypothetical protein [Ureibacillus sp. FSL E2-3493]|uniref:hypothetical protein n=1 Tax=Ureibacillus sp. FSL E2-3493 TaxID=2921367 RepID=UPI00311A6CAA